MHSNKLLLLPHHLSDLSQVIVCKHNIALYVFWPSKEQFLKRNDKRPISHIRPRLPI